MGDAQSIPVVGEAVTVIESGAKVVAASACATAGMIDYAITGDEKNKALQNCDKLMQGAGNSWKEYSEKNVVAASVQVLHHSIKGNDAEAERIAEKSLKSLEGFVDSCPVVGHVKGGVHYIAGDTEHGHKCMKGATRGAVVMAAGAVTGGVGGGAVLGGLAAVEGGLAYDLALSAAGDEPQGSVATLDNFIKTDDPNSIVDLGLAFAGDFASGAAAAESANQLVKARKIKNQQNSLKNKFEKAQKAPGVKKFDADLATKDAIQAGRNLQQLADDGILKGDNNVSTVVRDSKTNQTYKGINSRARQDVNVHKFETQGKQSGFTSKTNARKMGKGGASSLQEMHPEVKPVLKRPQQACAEHGAFKKFHAAVNSGISNAVTVTVKMVKGVCTALIRCENCLAYAELMGNVVTDFVNGQVVPLQSITPYINKGCACGALAFAARKCKAYNK